MKWVVRCKIGYYSFDVKFDNVEEAGKFMLTLLTNIDTDENETMYATMVIEKEGEEESGDN